MRSLRLGVAALVVSCLMAGCESGSGESTATPENPQAGLDAIKKLQSGPQPTAKGLMPITPQGKAEPPQK